jgi:hypothetical protein
MMRPVTIDAIWNNGQQSVERIVTLDPRSLTGKHVTLGDLNGPQRWSVQAGHDGIHPKQIRDVKASSQVSEA